MATTRFDGGAGLIRTRTGRRRPAAAGSGEDPEHDLIEDCASPPVSVFSSFVHSAMRHSVVSISPATLAAFCSAVRTTFTGSMTPMPMRLPYSFVAAL